MCVSVCEREREQKERNAEYTQWPSSCRVTHLLAAILRRLIKPGCPPLPTSVPFNPKSLYTSHNLSVFHHPHPFISATLANGVKQQQQLGRRKDPPGIRSWSSHTGQRLTSWDCLSNWVEITNPPPLLTLLSWISKYLWASISIWAPASRVRKEDDYSERRCLECI